MVHAGGLRDTALTMPTELLRNTTHVFICRCTYIMHADCTIVKELLP